MATAYIKDEQGGTFIPASQRPDGTWRKPRRVKDGYVPQEEVPLYESLGKQFSKNKVNYPVGMSPEYAASHKAKVEAEQHGRTTIPGMVILNEPKKKKKKSKSKATNSLADDLAKTSISEPEAPKAQQNKTNKSQQSSKSQKSQPAPSARQDGQSLLSDSMKRLKYLRKKLREIETLESKVKNGEIKNPEKEMLDKIGRKKDIADEIIVLESNQ